MDCIRGSTSTTSLTQSYIENDDFLRDVLRENDNMKEKLNNRDMITNGRDKMFLVCHIVSKDDVIKRPCELMSEIPFW